MLKKISKILFISLIINLVHMPIFAQVLDLSSAKDNFFIKTSEVYKPSKLLIGEETGFVIKAEPGTYVTLVFSGEDTGADPVHGQKLRLGTIIDKIEGVVGEKGVIELKLKLPEEDDLKGKILYFEALTWKQDDLSDLNTARIMGINGRETGNNALVVTQRIKDASKPVFGAAMAGMGNVSETMNALSEEDDDNLREQMYFKKKDIMHRNLNAPGVKEDAED